MDNEKRTPPHEGRQFEETVHKIDRALIGALVNVLVSIITTLWVLHRVGVF